MRRLLPPFLVFFTMIPFNLYNANANGFHLEKAEFRDSLTQTDKEIIKNIVNQKLGELENYLRVIADKEIIDAVRIDNIKSALDFFNRNAKMQISSLNHKNKENEKGIVATLDIEKYLYRLKDLPQYDSIIMDFKPLGRNIEVYRINSNSYEIRGEIKQTFQGFKNGEATYEDLTLKNAVIYFDFSSGKIDIENLKHLKFDKIDVMETLEFGDNFVDA